MAVCDGYPGVGLRRASPIVLLLPSSLVVVSELAPDTAFHRGGTAQAAAPNECRAGLLLLLLLQLLLARIRVGYGFIPESIGSKTRGGSIYLGSVHVDTCEDNYRALI